MTLKEVIDKYPKYFPDDQCGFECGDGWARLIEKICKRVVNVQNWVCPKLIKLNEHGHNCQKVEGGILSFNFEQIKEKFGTLQVYYSIKRKELDWSIFDQEHYNNTLMIDQAGFLAGFIDAMESMSGEICEDTGERGKLRTSKPWIRTLCDARAKELGYTD
jgi:hypothetical protein